MLPNGFQLQSLKELGVFEDIPETGTTIKENAGIKAQAVWDLLNQKESELIVFADDSGLEVKALNGEPGVRSARYAGETKNDQNNNSKLLHALKNITKREARFVTVIALVLKHKLYFFEGEIKGTIAYEPRGNSGFGYDPLFIPQGYRSTFAELGEELKNKISHRANAIEKLLDFLKSQK